MSSPTRIAEDHFRNRLLRHAETMYTALLPFLAALACYVLHSSFSGWVVAGGWLVVVLNLHFHVPLLQSGFKARPHSMLVALLPVGLLATKQGLNEGNLWYFFLDDMLLESGALILALAMIVLAGKRFSEKSAYESLGGPGMVILVIVILLGSMGGFVFSWLQVSSGQDAWEWLTFGLAAIAALWTKLSLFRAIRDEEFAPDPQGKLTGYMIAAIFAFLFLVPWIGSYLSA